MEAALPHLDEARRRFDLLKKHRMANLTLGEKADCLLALGHYDEAAEAYEQAIRIDEELQDPRSVAVDKGQLASVRHQPERLWWCHPAPLPGARSFRTPQRAEAMEAAVSWHQIGMVHEEVGGYEDAEQAYQKSLNLEIQTGSLGGQAQSASSQLGSLDTLGMGRTVEDAVRLYRQAGEIFIANGDLRREGFARFSTAREFIKLRRYDDARVEIDRAVECDKPFGHVAQPWKALDVLSDLERAVGNQHAAIAARDKALAAYLAYRRDGGAPQIDPTELIAIVKQDPDAARAASADPNINYGVAAEIILALEAMRQ